MWYRSIFCLCIVLSGCASREVPEHENVKLVAEAPKHAERFSITRKGAITYLEIKGDRNNYNTTAVFALCRDSAQNKNAAPGSIVINVPCRKIAALSSIYACMLAELGALDALAAIDNIDYVNNPQIIEKFRKGSLPELARSPEIDVEKAMMLHPDIIFFFGMGLGEADIHPKMREAGLPVAVSVDHLEKTPLARAEWIRVFALFAGRERQADSIFAIVERRYDSIRHAASAFREHPTVLSELKIGDTWYLPGGKSFMATLLKDAGAEYIFSEDDRAGSLTMSFEQVLQRAKQADYWINLSMVTSRREMLAQDKRYDMFAAFGKGTLFNNNKNVNALGYSTYWETGMIHPDRILEDLVHIFHDTIIIESKLHYYRRIE